MNGWSEALRQELQPDIRVTVIEPGAVATELTNHITDPAAKQGAEQPEPAQYTSDDRRVAVAGSNCPVRSNTGWGVI
jgi:NADP-dependent 3-hydroxy acid dehydrogenase YdfG